MEKYNYLEAVKRDVKDVIGEYNIDYSKDIEDNVSDLYDELWTNDSVTGNGSGSYTFDVWQAEENIAHNLGLLQEALEAFGGDFDLSRGAEYFDVTIRCYLLNDAIYEVLTEFYDKYAV